MATHWIVVIISVMFFDISTGIWWHCDDDNITEISYLPKVVYYRETHNTHEREKGNHGSINRCIVCCLYHNKPSENTALIFSRIHNHVQNHSYEESD